MSTTSNDRKIVEVLEQKLGFPIKVTQYANDRLLKLSLAGSALSFLPMELGQLTKLEVLDLSDNQLSQISVELGQLTSLRELYLSRNQLSELPVELGLLTRLQALDLSDNQLSQIPAELGKLTSLQELSLGNNELLLVPVELGQLTNLRKLWLNRNKLSQVPAELGKLRNLRLLDLSDNRLIQVPVELGQLTNLQSLDLSDNKLSQVPADLGQLTSLHELDLSRNQLCEIPEELSWLNSLNMLSLGNNQLSQLPPELGQLANLQELYLFGNQLIQIPVELEGLTNLRELDLRENQLSQVPPEFGQLAHLEYFFLENNPTLLTPPPEIVARGTPAILSFLQELQKDIMIRYEAKLLLVGEPSTGKSSLLRSLMGKKFELDLPSTHGIEINSLHLPYLHTKSALEEITLNVWDFGGQHIYQTTHQFFLTERSLYLVVWNANMEPEQCRLDFWLETIRSLAPDSPVLLIATHTDQRPPYLNYQLYKKVFPQLVGALSVSNKTGEGLEELKKVLVQQAFTLPLMGQPQPKKWIQAEEALLKRPEVHIDIETYVQICQTNGISIDLAKGTLGSYLHDLGKVLYFRDDEVLRKMVILKPNWVTKAISRVLDDKVTREVAKGILDHSEFARIWATDENEQPYDPQLYPIFLRLMERFELSYQIDPNDAGKRPTQSLVPQLLPPQPPSDLPPWPDVPSEGQMLLKMVYRFNFVPAGIMSWFIVRTHHHTKNLHWREGVCLAYQGHEARVELNPLDRKLYLLVWGLLPHNFFTLLMETIDKILSRFQGLLVWREIPCICHWDRMEAEPCAHFFSYEALVRRMEARQYRIECDKSFARVWVPTLLYGIHSSTDEQVMSDIQIGQLRIEKRLEELQKLDIILEKLHQQSELIMRNFARQWNLEMQKMEAECPNMFYLIPGANRMFNPKQWIAQNYRLFLMCQHPSGPHRVGDGYELRKAREWWVAISPWLRRLIPLLKYGVPMTGAIGAVIDAVDVKNWEAQINLLEKIMEDLADISLADDMDRKELSSHIGKVHMEGPALRTLYSFLIEADPEHDWSGLYKTLTPDGNILWLCDIHHEQYTEKALQIR